MTPDPSKVSLDTAQLPIPDALQHLLDQIPILDRFPVGPDPPVALPALEPHCDAFDGVVRVGEDDGGAVERADVESALEGCEFGALVGLAGAAEGFGDVSTRRAGDG